MDPVTQGLVGASASQLFADRKEIRAAAFVGAAGAMLPDLDVLISSSTDPLLQLEFHRQFTHSFLFAPVAALIATLLCWWFVKGRLAFKKTYLFCLAGTLTAGIVDIFTSYGVQLLWPFTDERFSWNLISVFDPLFSLVLIIALSMAIFKRKRLFSFFALGWVALYLLFAVSQKERAGNAAEILAEQQNHTIEQLIIKPTIANQMLWSIRYIDGDSLYTAGVRLLPFSNPEIYNGDSAKLLNWKDKFADFQGTTLYNDIKRFDRLSGGVLISHPDSTHVIGDGRYAMLPTSVKPLWGIKIDTTDPGRHVNFNTYRDTGPEVRSSFQNMLLGKPR